MVTRSLFPCIPLFFGLSISKPVECVLPARPRVFLLALHNESICPLLHLIKRMLFALLFPSSRLLFPPEPAARPSLSCSSIKLSGSGSALVHPSPPQLLLSLKIFIVVLNTSSFSSSSSASAPPSHTGDCILVAA